MSVTFRDAAAQIIEAGRFLDQKNLCPATSGNLSVRLDETTAAITASGVHKGALTEEDVLTIDFEGRAFDSEKEPSAETLLHTSLYAHYPKIGAVLHTHSLNGTLLTQITQAEIFKTNGYAIQKAFAHISSYDSEFEIPIFENSEDIASLSKKVLEHLQGHAPTCAYLLRQHGLFTWGVSLEKTKIYVEALEYLFASELALRMHSETTHELSSHSSHR